MKLVRYHLGTIAFGSLILATVRFIRYFLEYIDQKLKKKTNPIVDFILKYVACTQISVSHD